MKLSKPSVSLIESTLAEALNKLSEKIECDQTIITDIHFLPNQTSGELIIFDDDDEELSRCIIEEWIECDDKNFYEDAERVLRSILVKAKENGDFDNLSVVTPYSFVLVDEEKETISELLLMDGDTVLVSDELLKGLDEELDEFLKELLKV